MEEYLNFKRRKTREVNVGGVPMGGDNSIRLQSMVNVSTMDTNAAVEQIKRIEEAGGEYVRLTTQGVREATNLGKIKQILLDSGDRIPLVADVHFNPQVADVAATLIDKVRINPGNYIEGIKRFKHFEYTEEEYQEELKKLENRFIPFLNLCKKHHTVVRIGVNHGSLSDRIMSRFGDTPKGMVESCMEFLRICVQEEFFDVVISMKSSIPLVMVESVRLLVQAMRDEGMNFPLHLGVTEAGEGEDGRVKSAVGIGVLLADGIGDTVRVSLSEAPEKEIPVARKLVDYAGHFSEDVPFDSLERLIYKPNIYLRDETNKVGIIGADQSPIVISDSRDSEYIYEEDFKPDFFYIKAKDSKRYLDDGVSIIVDFEEWEGKGNPLFRADQLNDLLACKASIVFLKLKISDLNDALLERIKGEKHIVVIHELSRNNALMEQRYLHAILRSYNCLFPVVSYRSYETDDLETLQVQASVDLGSIWFDGLGNGLMISAPRFTSQEVVRLAFGILQAVRLRITKTEYISCPGCGRTMYNLEQTIAQIKKATAHLKGLKIGVMGCIVNGPGEMADADYGYVGSGRKLINLYKGKECVLKNIPEEDAVERLVELIKENEDWE